MWNDYFHSSGYCDGEERISRMRDELAGSESQRGSASSSPSPRQTTTRDFPAILKNLKTLDNVLQLVDDVLFGEAGLDDWMRFAKLAKKNRNACRSFVFILLKGV